MANYIKNRYQWRKLINQIKEELLYRKGFNDVRLIGINNEQVVFSCQKPAAFGITQVIKVKYTMSNQKMEFFDRLGRSLIQE